jgi:tetratricopeptide (TPR) repeat protein
MDTANVIKQYLVSLGFQVDNQGFNKFNKTLQDVSSAIQSHTSGWVKNYTVAATAITTVLTTITAATAGLIDKTAQLDLQYQKLALHMYMGVQQAKEYKIATDAMGENINDIAWMPELRQRYLSLIDQQKQMQLPNDAEGMARHIRDVRFEFTRFKVEMTYGMQWMGYWLMKYLQKPIDNLLDGFIKLNNWITNNMSDWTSKIAAFFLPILNLVSDIVSWVQTLYDVWLDYLNIAKDDGELSALKQALTAVENLTGAVVKLVAAFFKTQAIKDLFQSINQQITYTINLANLLANQFAGLFDAISAFLSGDLTGAVKILHQMDKQLAKDWETYTAGGTVAGSTGDIPSGSSGVSQQISPNTMGSNSSYDDIISAASQKYGVPVDIIRGVIGAESTWNPRAVSPAGAMGLMQLMPSTAASLGVTNAFDPYQNIMGGTLYLAEMYKSQGNWNDALRAYNGGPSWRNPKTANSTENQQYVGRVAANMPGGSGQSYGNYIASNYSPNGSMGGSGSSVNTNIGTINVQLPPGTSNPSQYAAEIAKQLNAQIGLGTSRQLRVASGISTS